MINKMISLPNNLHEQLSKEENASGLISSLLYEHYRLKVKSKEEIEERQRRIEEERKILTEKLAKDYAVLENKKQVIIKTEEIEQEQKEKEKIHQGIKEQNIRSFFRDEMGREMTQEELKGYLKNLEEKSGYTFYKYIEELREKEAKTIKTTKPIDIS